MIKSVTLKRGILVLGEIFKKMRKIDPKIESIIYHFLRGECSESEQEILEAWLREDRHKVLFEKICDKENILKKSFNFDKLEKGRKKTWNRLEREIGLRRRVVVYRWLVAAFMVIPFLIGGVYLSMHQTVSKTSDRQLEQIVPGISTAQ